MRKKESPHKFESLSDLHRVLGLPKPMHPLISLINGTDKQTKVAAPNEPHILNFYKISFSPKPIGRIKYGQHDYDFAEGGILFASPNQIIGGNENTDNEISNLVLLIHPDFLLGTQLTKKIKQYSFFSYSVNEALHLSDTEKETMLSIFSMIEQELESRIDDFSQDVIISQIELLLNYSNRFYKRQFITRKAVNSGVLQRVEEILNYYFDNEKLPLEGIPTVKFLSEILHISPSCLSDILRQLTGENAQQHIHSKLIEKAKEKLSTTNCTVTEIAYDLGFEHSQSFSRLFKTKTRLSPLEFRHTFN